MTVRRTPADRRDEQAADRDDAADHRDDAARGRDAAADKRDAEATDRDEDARQDADDLFVRLRTISEQILDRLARLENATVDADDWPDLTPAGLARLEAHTAEQRRLAGLDRVAVTHLFDQLQHEIGHLREDRQAAARDRHASAGDRRLAAGNRHDSGHDRVLSAGDRDQSAIERAQVDPRDLAADACADPLPVPPAAPAAHAIASSRQRISDSHQKITRGRRPAVPPTQTSDPPSRTPDT